MAIDINAIRRKLGSLQTTNNKTSLLWKPEPGQNTIRIVPYQFNKENPFIEFLNHAYKYPEKQNFRRFTR